MIQWSEFSSPAASRVFPKQGTWGDLAQRLLDEHVYSSKETCPWIKLARFGDKRTAKKSLRHDANVVEVYGIEGDYDAGQMTPEEAIGKLEDANVRAIVYTSPSHTPEKPRWRVLAPCSKPMPASARSTLLARINGVLGGILADESFVLSQSYYFGRVNDAPEYRVLVTFDDPDEGECVDLLDELDAGAIGKVNGKANGTDHREDWRYERKPGEDAFAAEVKRRGRLLRSGDGRRGMLKQYISSRSARGVRDDDIRVLIDGIAARYFDPADPIDEKNIAEIVQWAKHKDEQKEETPAENIRGARIDWRALSGKTPPKREWWIDQWLGPVPTLIAGKPGMGKTLLAQQVGSASALAKPSFGAFVADRPLRSLIWACEDDQAELWRRQHDICHWLGAGMDKLAGMLEVEPRVGLQNTLMTLDFNRPVWTSSFVYLREQVNDLKIDILWLDNITQTFGGNENDPHHVSFYVNGISGLVSGRPFCPVFLGWPARAAGSEFGGSRAWEGAVRMRWFLGDKLPDQQDDDSAGDESIRYLCKRKANYSARDYMRLAYRDGTLWNADPMGTSRMRADPAKAAEAVLDGFRRLVEMGIRASDMPQSPDYLPKQLAAKKLVPQLGPKDVAKAMHELMTSGRLRRDKVGKYPKGQDKWGLVEDVA